MLATASTLALHLSLYLALYLALHLAERAVIFERRMALVHCLAESLAPEIWGHDDIKKAPQSYFSNSQ